LSKEDKMEEIVFGSNTMQLLIALILVSTFMILGSTRLYSCIRAFGMQSFLLACVAGTVAYSTGKDEIYIIAILTLLFKSIVIPYFLIYIIHEIKVKREVELYVKISPSLIIGGMLVVISYYLIRSIHVISELSSFALSASMSLVSIGLFIMISRKKCKCSGY
jgi:hydrogenase-4 component E